jgi:hypothetical protein
MAVVGNAQESALRESFIREFAVCQFGVAPGSQLIVHPLHGGLETCGIACVTVGPAQQMVVKRLVGGARREVAIYQQLSPTPAATALPRYLGHVHTSSHETYLFLEWVPRHHDWPWSDVAQSTAVMERLALIHRQDVCLPDWDYGADLSTSAVATLDLLAHLVFNGNAPSGRPMLKTLERAVDTLPAMRQALARAHQSTLLHGDAHASNAVSCTGQRARIVLLDWGRARMGSPLEDVSSWLQSVGFWEWEVRRRHDTLLRRYLAARGWNDRITPELRSLCWFAAASNALAGALRYHLAVANDIRRGDNERYLSAKAAQDWLRMIRRADVTWRN